MTWTTIENGTTTNYCLWSEDAENSVWNPNLVTTENEDGFYKITDTAVSGVHQLRQQIVLSTSENIGVSLKAKAGTIDTLVLWVVNETNTSNTARVDFDLDSFSVNQEITQGSGVVVSSFADHVEDDFCLCRFVCNVGATEQIRLLIRLNSALAYVGDGSYLYLKPECQVEISDEITGYVKTEGSPVSQETIDLWLEQADKSTTWVNQ